MRPLDESAPSARKSSMDAAARGLAEQLSTGDLSFRSLSRRRICEKVRIGELKTGILLDIIISFFDRWLRSRSLWENWKIMVMVPDSRLVWPSMYLQMWGNASLGCATTLHIIFMKKTMCFLKRKMLFRRISHFEIRFLFEMMLKKDQEVLARDFKCQKSIQREKRTL